MDMDTIVCPCLGLTAQDIKDAVENGATSFEEVQDVTEVGSICGACIDEVKELIAELLQ